METTSAPRFNGEIMRGYGLTFDGVNRFTTTQSIDLGAVTISRSVYINNSAHWGRWLDSFTNTTNSPMSIRSWPSATNRQGRSLRPRRGGTKLPPTDWRQHRSAGCRDHLARLGP